MFLRIALLNSVLVFCDAVFEGTSPIVCCVESTETTPAPRPVWTLKNVPTTTQPLWSSPIYLDNNNAERCPDIDPSMTSAKTGQKAFNKCIEYQERFVYPCERSVALSDEFTRSNNCYHIADRLIVGGNDTHAHEFPHMVMLGYRENEHSIQWFCGGSIISEKYILSAAHCNVTNNLEVVEYVLIGALTRSDADDPSKIYKVKTIIMHPDHKPPSKYNDIMLLETEKRITLSPYVVPACLHVGDSIEDESVLATGWGFLGAKKRSFAEVMQKVILQKFTTEECSILYNGNDRHLPRDYDPQSMLCYGHRTKAMDSCQGDSGGPIQIKSKRVYCMYTIVGVTSFGLSRRCGIPGEPAIYTRIAHYVPWIESIVWP